MTRKKIAFRQRRIRLWRTAFVLLAMTGFFLSALPAMAEETGDNPKIDLFISEGLQETAVAAGFSKEPKKVATVVGDSISILLGIIGIIFLVLMLYAGVLYLTAGGEEDKVKKAKRLIADSVIGIIIVVAAYALTRFVVQILITAASSP